jgi:hypothetical protein
MQRAKSNEFNKEVDKTSELLGDPSSTRFGEPCARKAERL